MRAHYSSNNALTRSPSHVLTVAPCSSWVHRTARRASRHGDVQPPAVRTPPARQPPAPARCRADAALDPGRGALVLPDSTGALPGVGWVGRGVGEQVG